MSPAEQLDWPYARYATSYDIYRNGVFYHAVAGSADLYTFIGFPIVNGPTNSYYVVAKNAAGTTTSNTVTFTIPADICVTMPPIAVLSGSAQCHPQTHQPFASLNWTSVPAAFGWQLYRDGAPYVVPHSGLFYADTNVVSGHTYTYNIATYGLSAPLSNPITITVSDDICLPGAVTVTTTAFCNGATPAVQLNWNASVNAATYTVLRNGATLASGLRDPVYVDSSPNSGATYAYQVIATNGIGSTPSAPTTIAVGDETCPPSSFTSSALSICSNATPSVLLTWSKSAHAASYAIYRDDVPVGGTLPATASEYIDAPGAGFHSYGIKATNAAGYNSSGTSGFVSAAACASAPGTFTASATSFCSAGKQAVHVQWTPAAGATSYTVIRNGVTMPAAALPATTYDDAAVDIGQSYTYRVVASNGTGNSTAAAGTITPSSGDCPPGNFTLAAIAGCNPPVALAWTSAPNSSIFNYTIFRNQISIATVGPTTFSYSEDSALPSGSYSYFVRAAGFGGVSDSNTFDVTVDRTHCAGTAPNLTAIDIKPSVLSGRAGDAISIAVELANVGNASAMPATARIRFGRGPSMSPSDPVLTAIPLPAMSSGSDVQRTLNVKLPAVAAGTYYVFLSLDEEHVSGEANVGDNVKGSVALTVGDMIPPKHRAAAH
jgi:fibronectin type 3 domain-containing protein